MKLDKYYFLFALMLSSLLLGCSDDADEFGNQVYTNISSEVNTLLIKPSLDSSVQSLSIAMARPEDRVVTVSYKADPSLVARYNERFYDNAVALEADYYNIPESTVEIKPGGVRSNEINIEFVDINLLDRDVVYVLPVTIANSNIKVLESKRTVYYVFKGAALINVVPDIEENYFVANSWNNPAPLTNLSELTIEALIRVRDYSKMISTVMGIEGHFLIRLGDAGFPSNQIQVVTPRGNFPDGDSSKGLPQNQWVHMAVTYKSSGDVEVYVDGKLQSSGKTRGGSVTLARAGDFYIGRSYEDSRYLSGEISECRIWNVIRTQEEIANNFYEVDPESEGLVAYWKCDDGVGNEVKDHTSNENHLKSKTDVKWNSVSLPEK